MLKTSADADPRIIFAGHLVGSATICQLLSISRATLVRRIERGDIQPLAQLDGPTGAYVFDRSDFPAEVTR